MVMERVKRFFQNFYVRYCGGYALSILTLYAILIIPFIFPLRDDYSDAEDPFYILFLLSYVPHIAAILIALLFVKDHKRAPARMEIVKFGSTLAAINVFYIISYFLIGFSMTPAEERSPLDAQYLLDLYGGINFQPFLKVFIISVAVFALLTLTIMRMDRKRILEFLRRYTGAYILAMAILFLGIIFQGLLPMEGDYAGIGDPPYVDTLMTLVPYVAALFPAGLYMFKHQNAWPRMDETFLFAVGTFLLLIVLNFYIQFQYGDAQGSSPEPDLIWFDIRMLFERVIHYIGSNYYPLIGSTLIFALLPRAVFEWNKKEDLS